MYDPITQNIFQASTVLFDEQSFGIEELIEISKQLGVAPRSFENTLDEVDVEEAPHTWIHDMNQILKDVDISEGNKIYYQEVRPQPEVFPAAPMPVSFPGEEPESAPLGEAPGEAPPPLPSVPTIVPNQVPAPSRRSSRQKNIPIELSSTKFCGLARGHPSTGDAMSRRTPKNYKQAAKGPEWMEPMRKEYQNLVDNNTFELISPK
jgi:hypothetical protein